MLNLAFDSSDLMGFLSFLGLASLILL